MLQFVSIVKSDLVSFKSLGLSGNSVANKIGQVFLLKFDTQGMGSHSIHLGFVLLFQCIRLENSQNVAFLLNFIFLHELFLR